jgi:hypothetical protein
MRLMGDDMKMPTVDWIEADKKQYGGSPVKVGDEEYSLFRDYEYVVLFWTESTIPLHITNV